MKRIGNLFEKIYDYENLYASYLEARKGKRYRTEVMEFSANLDGNLIELQNELIWHTYKVGRYREFFVHDPKKRLIMALPFRDRIIQWSIYRQLNPLLEKRYINTSFGCRMKCAPIKGGPHSAVAKLQEYIRAQPGKAYILKMDISKYFYRVNHAIMMDLLRQTIKDEELLWLLGIIVNSEHDFGINIGDHDYCGERLHDVGMPIGNLSSQMLANFYLDGADKFAKHELGAKYYLRYMDDMTIVSTDKKYLAECRDAMYDFLLNERALLLNNKTSIRTETQGVDFCGFRIWRDHILLRKKTALKMKHRLKGIVKRFARGKANVEDFVKTYASYNGQMRHCDSYRLRTKLLSSICLQRKEVAGDEQKVNSGTDGGIDDDTVFLLCGNSAG